MNSEEAEAVGRQLQDALKIIGDHFGPILAQYTRYGSMASVGSCNQSNPKQRFIVVFATNDAATELNAWFDSEIVKREAAHKKTGMGAIIDYKPSNWPL